MTGRRPTMLPGGAILGSCLAHWARVGIGLVLLLGPRLRADDAPEPERLSIHGQATWNLLGHDSFRSPYEGPNSFLSRTERRGSLTATLFAGVRVSRGTELYANVEAQAGQGPSAVLGLTSPPNGETYRVDSTRLKVSMARLFVRQTFELGGGSEDPAPGANQRGGPTTARRLVVTAGKFSATDVFDDNRYAHDPRTEFNSWSVWANGAWDYPADTRGYTWGLAAELRTPPWAVRAGALLVPREANGMELDHDVARANGLVLELEHAHALGARPGAVRLLVFRNRARMGSYREAMELPFPPDVASTREVGRTKSGVGVNVEQELLPGLGAFLRAGWNDGTTESWAFTEIDRTICLGLSLEGRAWGRPDDRLGVAAARNGLSGDHRAYLEVGGLGFMLGDGRLAYRPEQLLEAYYGLQVVEGVRLSAEVQSFRNPGANSDRGPVTVWGLRVHVER